MVGSSGARNYNSGCSGGRYHDDGGGGYESEGSNHQKSNNITKAAANSITACTTHGNSNITNFNAKFINEKQLKMYIF